MSAQTFETDDWRVDLPDDWRHLGATADGAQHFESADRRQALYIAVWNVGDGRRPASELVQEFVQAECASLDELPGHHWRHAPHATGPGEALVDSLEAQRHFRVVCRLIARPPRVLRASFHDLNCRSVDESNRLLGPLLDSVALTGWTADRLDG